MRRAARGQFAEDIVAAMNGRMGTLEQMTGELTARYSRHTAQAVLRLIEEAKTYQDRAEGLERQVMRQEAGFH